MNFVGKEREGGGDDKTQCKEVGKELVKTNGKFNLVVIKGSIAVNRSIGSHQKGCLPNSYEDLKIYQWGCL